MSRTIFLAEKFYLLAKPIGAAEHPAQKFGLRPLSPPIGM
jgi:hypothetical protein